eukprot:3249204-Amphidinium_carterae.1
MEACEEVHADHSSKAAWKKPVVIIAAAQIAPRAGETGCTCVEALLMGNLRQMDAAVLALGGH